ncbi:MAG: hypothetical protein HYX61_13470 [Gammaproteobacteria bacterium]|nr:hypothetical protein [Gammaproteobacteria bacterium]
MRNEILSAFILVMATLSTGCANMTEQSSGPGAVAGSPAGRQASTKKGPGSLGTFLHTQNQKSQVKSSK